MNTEKILGQIIRKHETRLGTYWVPDEPPGDYIGVAMREGRLFDEHVFTMLKSYINENSVVLDIGSNFGQMALEFSKTAKTVHAFEAHPFIYEILLKNINESQRTNIIPHMGAVWNDNNLELFYPDFHFTQWNCLGSHGIDPTVEINDKGTVIKSLTIDSLNLPQVNVVKIDVQGSDLRAMKGMIETIKRCKPVIVFEFEPGLADNKFKEPREMYLKFIEEINYTQIGFEKENYLIVPK